MKRLIRFVLIAVLLASPAFAQQVPEASEDPVADAPIRLGVVGVRPRLGITDFGVDTNVFNSQTNKQRDITFTIRPGGAVARCGSGANIGSRKEHTRGRAIDSLPALR